MPPGRRRPTIEDIAEAVGVSKSAVSRAMNGEARVSPATRDLVLAAASDLGYVRNAMAATMVARRSGTIGLAVRAARLGFYGELIDAMQARAGESGYQVIMAAASDRDDELDVVTALLGLRVDGIVLASGAVKVAAVAKLAAGTPTMLIGRRSTLPGIGFVTVDDARASRQLVELVVGHGHREVGVVDVPRAVSSTRSARSRAMVAELDRRGAAVTPIPLGRHTDTPDADALLAAAGRVTAIMTPNDPALLATAEILDRAGYRIPDDVSLTGFDGAGDLGSPWLGVTTWRQPLPQMGSAAIDDLLARVADRGARPIRTVLDGDLVVGRTLGAQRSET